MNRWRVHRTLVLQTQSTGHLLYLLYQHVSTPEAQLDPEARVPSHIQDDRKNIASFPPDEGSWTSCLGKLFVAVPRSSPYFSPEPL